MLRLPALLFILMSFMGFANLANSAELSPSVTLLQYQSGEFQELRIRTLNPPIDSVFEFRNGQYELARVDHLRVDLPLSGSETVVCRDPSSIEQLLSSERSAFIQSLNEMWIAPSCAGARERLTSLLWNVMGPRRNQSERYFACVAKYYEGKNVIELASRLGDRSNPPISCSGSAAASSEGSLEDFLGGSSFDRQSTQVSISSESIRTKTDEQLSDELFSLVLDRAAPNSSPKLKSCCDSRDTADCAGLREIPRDNSLYGTMTNTLQANVVAREAARQTVDSRGQGTSQEITYVASDSSAAAAQARAQEIAQPARVFAQNYGNFVRDNVVAQAATPGFKLRAASVGRRVSGTTQADRAGGYITYPNGVRARVQSAADFSTGSVDVDPTSIPTGMRIRSIAASNFSVTQNGSVQVGATESASGDPRAGRAVAAGTPGAAVPAENGDGGGGRRPTGSAVVANGTRALGSRAPSQSSGSDRVQELPFRDVTSLPKLQTVLREARSQQIRPEIILSQEWMLEGLRQHRPTMRINYQGNWYGPSNAVKSRTYDSIVGEGR